MTKSGKINQYIHKSGYCDKHNLINGVASIMEATRFSDNITESIYCILNDIFQCPKCVCGNLVKFEQFGKGYRKYCSVKCRANDPEWNKTRTNTNLEKYGVKHIAQLPNERLKRSDWSKSLNRSKFDTSKQAEKRRNTILLRYGPVNTGWLSDGRKTRIKNGHNCEASVEYKQYRKDVRWFTERNDLTVLDNFDKRDNHSRNKDAYHLDHIVSISHCYNAEVPPEIAGSIANLRFIPWRENLSKQSKSGMTPDELIGLYNERIR